MSGRIQFVRTGLVALAYLAFCLWAALWATAQEPQVLKGIALVIGQSDYQALTVLANPKADARAMEERLSALGFKTDLALDEGARKLKRTVSGFIEDAEGADVALVYYSGHAIEVGGVNYLIPTDAGVSSLDAAEESFVPLQQVLDELRRKAKITVLLIDACRTNPFPTDALLRKTQGAPGEPMSPTGIAATKGVTILTTEGQVSPENLGEVVGYAAAPGAVALDGPAGTNSPYAAALLKHLSANQSYDFSQVMTLVTEEVYLATQTRQRPWTNASLRRFLTFGGKVAEASPDDARIKDARRTLLLTIAATPQETRGFVESLAKEQKLPLDLVYGMLKELQVDTASGPEEIEKQLREGVERAKQQKAERDALRQSDPQIIELAKLADRAEAEGALGLAAEYWAKASKRTDELADTRERNKTDVTDRAREAASVYARHAQAAILAFDHETAGREYGKAYREIEWFDAGLAFRYKLAEADALRNHGDYKGVNDALRQSLALYSLAVTVAERAGNPDSRGTARNNLGNTLRILGERENDSGSLRKAVATLEAALTDRSRERVPLSWAATQNNLGNALTILGGRETGTESLRKAIVAFEAALTERTRERVPLQWATTQNNLGNAFKGLSERESGTDSLRKAVAAYEAALTELTRERAPLDWALTQNNLGTAFQGLGERESGTKSLRKAVMAYEAALIERTRERVPLQWAATQSNLGAVLQILGERETGTDSLRKAVAAYEAALTERTRERVPLQWATTQNNLGIALRSLGERESDIESLRKAVLAFEAALTEHTREQLPLKWAGTQNNLGNALKSLGERESGTDSLRKASAAYEAALTEQTRERVPLRWAAIQNNLGVVLRTLGERESGTDTLRKAVTALEAALTERTRERVPLQWSSTQNNLGVTFQILGERETGTDSLRKAVTAYEAALTERRREQMPLQWAITQNNLGYSLAIIGERTGDVRHIEKAIPLLRAALQEQNRLNDPLSYHTADSLCRALLGLGARNKDRSMLMEAKTHCLSALKGGKDQQMDQAVRRTEANLASVEKALAVID